MKNKKLWFILVAGILVILASIFLIRILTPEDTWICDDGQWVRHGNPTQDMPIDACVRK